MSENTKNITGQAAESPAEGGNVVELVNAQPAEKAQETPSSGVYVHKFSRPFTYEGITYETMEFPFERLTGRDMVKIEAEMQAQGEYAVAAEISRSFQAHMAARAAGVHPDVLEAMPINEFNRITNAARDFLIATGF